MSSTSCDHVSSPPTSDACANDGTPLLGVTNNALLETEGGIAEEISHSHQHASTGRNTASSFRSILLRRGSSVVAPFADDSGSAESVKSGLLTILCFGTILGLIMPKNKALPSPFYRTLSSIMGYSYFLSWSVSFYPQVVLNYQRETTVGLSNDFSVINHVGYICYSIYTCSLFWSPSLQDIYRDRNGPDATITVQSNDVCFALHAWALSLVWIIQIAYYGRFKVEPLLKFTKYALYVIAFICSGFVLLILSGVSRLTWLDFMYLLSFVKVAITITKYVPQVVLNAQRLSTLGWNIWNVTLDVMGGSLSLLQLLFDSADMHDLSGISGNSAKLGLSVVTIFFDAIFFYQHYILYRQPPHTIPGCK